MKREEILNELKQFKVVPGRDDGVEDMTEAADRALND